MNIRGKTNFDELKYVLLNSKPDICLLSETHVTENCDTNNLKMRNYKMHFCFSHSNHTGGVIAYIREQIKVKNVQSYKSDSVWILSFELSTTDEPILIAIVYLACKENKGEILDYLIDWMDTNIHDKPAIICGDFNLNMLKQNNYTNRLQRKMEEFGMKLIVDQPTRKQNESATLIDLCLTNISVRKINCTVTDEDQIADHMNLVITINTNRHEYKNCKETQRIVWKNYSEEKLCEQIITWINQWDEVKNKSVDEKMTWLVMNLKGSIEKLIYKSPVKIRDSFFDRTLELMRKEKNRLYKIAQYSSDSNGNNDNWRIFKQYKNEYKCAIRMKKYEYNQKKLNNAKGDMKLTWKVLNNIMNKESEQISYIKSDENIIENNCHMAEAFNKYFVESIEQINNEIDAFDYVNNVQFEIAQPFKFKGVSIGCVKRALRELKNNTDEFYLNKTTITDAMPLIGTMLTNIINDSLTSGKFPEILKCSIIIPIHKKTGTILINEFRPINMLPCAEKIIEKIVYGQFAEYVNSNNILREHQSGFRQAHSCETALNGIIHEWKSARERNKIILVTFLDFQRAFETIEPVILLEKLHAYGIRDNELNWFDSYLMGRKQKVRLQDAVSMPIDNQLGVPQGSILGPLLFILYVNDIGNCLQHCKIEMFADDTAIYTMANTVGEATRLMNEDLTILYKKNLREQAKIKRR